MSCSENFIQHDDNKKRFYGTDLLKDRATDDQLTERDIATPVEMRHDTHVMNDGNEHMTRFT